jgi:nitrogen fixation protein NifU and related proteins
MSNPYGEIIADHIQYPRNRGTLDAPTFSHEDHNPLCGDKIRIDVLIEDGRIADIRQQGRGCSLSQAAASALSEELKGKSVEEARAFGKDALLDLIEMPQLAKNPVRIKCVLLPLKTFKLGLYGLAEIAPDDEEEL